MRISAGLPSSEEVFGIVPGWSAKLVSRNELVVIWRASRRPVVTANSTKVLSLKRKFANNPWISLLVRISGAVHRVALCRTHWMGLRSHRSCRRPRLNNSFITFRILQRVPNARFRDFSHDSTSTARIFNSRYSPLRGSIHFLR